MRKLKLNVGAVLSYLASNGAPSEALEGLSEILAQPKAEATLIKQMSTSFVVGIDIDGLPVSILTMPNEALVLIEIKPSERDLLIERQKELMSELTKVNQRLTELSDKKFH